MSSLVDYVFTTAERLFKRQILALRFYGSSIFPPKKVP